MKNAILVLVKTNEIWSINVYSQIDAPAFYAGVYDATSTGFNIGLWLDANGKPWEALVYYIACGKI